MCGTKQAGIIARTRKTMIRTFWLGYGKICETNESAVAAHGDHLPVAVKTVHLTVPQHRFIRFSFNEKIRTFRFGYGKNVFIEWKWWILRNDGGADVNL